MGFPVRTIQWRLFVLFATWLLTVSGGAAVRITEFLAANSAGLRDSDGEFSDWIEIHNDGATAVNLTGWSLTDDPESTMKWVFPATNIAPNAYLVVFASGKDRRIPGAELHTGFSLDADGEYLGMFAPEAIVAASEYAPAFPRQSDDTSFGERAGSRYFFRPPSPRAVNVGGIADYVADTKFSHDRGFYTDSFTLSISSATPGATIRYTTNGTVPSLANGFTYTAPIGISQTTVIRAAAFKDGFQPSNTDTHSYLFLSDVILQAADGRAPAGWPASWGANVVNYGMDPEVVNSAAYKSTIIRDLQTLPSFCVTVRLGDLFDASTGIYANPGQDGREWERPCSLELVNPDGTQGFQVNAGIRIRGGFSRSTSNPKHALRFFFRETYGNSKLKYPLFGDQGTDEFDNLDLRTFQNYSWSFQGDSQGVFIRDQFSRDTQLAMGHQGERGDYYHLYINGQYWGIFNTCERPEASYGETYFGGRKEDYDVIKVEAGPYAINATDGNLTAWTRLYNLLRTTPVSNELYQRIQGLNLDGTPKADGENLLDVDNLIDYMLVILYGGNLDAPISNFLGNDSPNNWYGLRNRSGMFGGFRFISHDAEHTLLNVNQDRTGPFAAGNDSVTKSSPQWMWQQLSSNPEFRLRVADHVQKHFFSGGVLTPQSAAARFNVRRQQLDRAVVGESARWGDSKREPALTRDNAWLPAINSIVNNYLPQRSAIVLNQLRSKSLFPPVSAPTFSVVPGSYPSGTSIILTAAAGASIYYTTDGSDPRVPGSSVSPSAKAFGGSVALTESMLIRARVLSGTVWSPIVEGVFTVQQDRSGLRISELMYHPPPLGTNDSDSLEFVEFQNVGSAELDLGGVRFGMGVEFNFPLGTKLSSGQFLVLARDPDAFRQRYDRAIVFGEYSGRFTDSGERVTVLDPAGQVLIDFTYSDKNPWPKAADGEGFSLVPSNSGSPENSSQASAWRSSNGALGSAGSIDPAPNLPRVFVNEVLAHTDPPQKDFIELFNFESIDVNISGWWISDDRNQLKKYRLPLGTVIKAGGYLVLNEDLFNSAGAGTNAFTFSSHGDEAYLASANGAGDLTGWLDGFNFGASANGISFARHTNSVGRLLFLASQSATPESVNSPPFASHVLINEIHPRPASGEIEFIEIRNTTSLAVALHDPANPENTWDFAGIDFKFPAGTTLGAKAYAVLCSGDPGVFRRTYGIPAEVQVFGPFLGALSDSGERLSLRRPDAPDRITNGIVVQTFVPRIVMDSVSYATSAPWPALVSGASLERNPTGELSDDPASWKAALFSPSPGTENAGNRAPSVVAGADVEFTSPSYPFTALVSATAKDDGLPAHPGRLTYAWTQSGGPIGAVILNPDQASTSIELPGQGSYLFEVTVLDGERSVSDSVAVQVGRREGEATLLAAGSIWRYLDSGPYPGDAWRGRDFNDAQWKSGPAEFGYSVGDASDTQTTVLDFGGNNSNKRPAYYFRTQFNIPSASSVTSLTGRLLRDDGAVVYLNGREVIRDNMPETAITNTTFASSVVGGGDESTFFERPMDASFLRDGDNLLAVEVHQVNAGSSDLSFDFQLMGTIVATNRAPIVDAGPDQNIQVPSPALLRGKFQDDGLPTNPGVPTFLWSKVSGPGNVSFMKVNHPVTSAQFSEPGAYVLRFRVGDGAIARFDELAVNVTGSVVPPAPRLEIVRGTPLVVKFLAAEGSKYRAERQNVLGNSGWATIRDFEPGAAREVSFEILPDGAAGFIRVVIPQ